MEVQGHGSTNNNHLEAIASTGGNNHVPPSSSSQNPFLVPSDATNNTVKVGMSNGSSSTYPSDDMLGLHSPSTYESPGGNLFHEQTNTNSKAPVDAFDSWQNQPSACQIVPTNVESHNPFQNQEHTHVSENATNKFHTNTNAPPKLGLDSHTAAKSSDDDIPISYIPKEEHYDDTVGQYSTSVSPGSNLEHSTNKGSEIQNPPVQVMERPKEYGASSQYVFPSHVFARNNTNAPVEWSTASNESLFSIYMGNMSFSSELACFKSCELDKPGDVYIPDQPNTSPNQQPPTPVNKFNDISQRTAELHEESSKVTEAQAAETMREVIMESSRTIENVDKKEDRNSNSRRQSDGSTQSYAFQTSTDGDKSVSSKGAGEKQKPQKQTEQKEATNAVDQAPKSNAPPNRWLTCFSCCTFCH